MPIIFSAIRVCEKCDETFKWHCFRLSRQKISSEPIMSEPMPLAITLAHVCDLIDNDIYDVQVNCPFCGYDNHFDYNRKQR